MMCRLDLWRRERQNSQYDLAFGNSSGPSTSSESNPSAINTDVRGILATFSMLKATAPSDLQSAFNLHRELGSTCPTIAANANLVDKLSSWIEKLQYALNVEHASSMCSICGSN